MTNYADATHPHHLTGIVDETGLVLQSLTYNDRGEVIKSTLAGETDSLSIEYQKDYKRVVTDSDGVTTYELDVKQGVAQVKSLVGPGCSSSCGDSSGSSYTYDTRQQLTMMTDGRGNKTSYTYDGNGNLTTKTEAYNNTTLARTFYRYYDANNRLTSRTDPSATNGYSKTTSYTYDSQGNLLTRTVKGYVGATLTTAVTTYTTNSQGQLTSIVDPLNRTTALTYYANDPGQGQNRAQLHTLTNALGQVFTFSNYGPSGKPGTITGPDGQSIQKTYSLTGKVLSQTFSGLTTSFVYDDADRLSKITLPGGRTLSYTYTGDQVASITDGLGNAIRYSVDAKGRRIGQSLHDPQGALRWTMQLAYDSQGNVSKRMFPGNAGESYEYDAARNLVKGIDPMGTETTISYDALNRPLVTVEDGDAVSSLAYDRQDNRTSLTDARGHVTASTWDDFGNERTIQSPDTGLTKLSYDLAGNLTTMVDAKNQTVAYSYDALNRPVKQTYPNAARDVLLTWDTVQPGRLSTVQEESSSRSFSYNNRGQVTAEARTIGSNTATVGYGYDQTTGDLVSLTYPSGRVVSYSRNAMGQITGIQIDGAPLASAVQYLPFGPVTSATLGAVSLSKTFDQRYQVSRIQAGAFDAQYVRDAAGRVVSVTGLIEPDLTPGTTTTTVNSAGNRVATVGADAWVHDANGNLTSDGINTYVWDALNRLVQVKQGSAVLASYIYDTQNRRIGKTVGSVTTHFVYDLNNNLIAETLADGTPIRDYFYLNGEPLAVREYQNSPGLYYFINDHLGTPRQLVNASGAVVWQAAYLPYGEAQVQANNAVTNNLRFPGQYFDAETGLHYNWNRYYDPITGRYLSADPIGLDGGLNLYAYVGGNPVNRIDPLGLASYTSFEGHYVVGGGLTGLKCCTEDGRSLQHIYVKVCVGVAFGGSLSMGSSSNSDGKSCSNPAKNLLSGEISGAFIFGIEGGVAVDTGGSGASVYGGGGFGSGHMGLEIKSTGCYYRYLFTINNDNRCECENK